MAKMYYSLEEATKKLGVDEQAVKKMITDGKLQQFQDSGNVTLKKDEVDAIASGGGGGADVGATSSGDPGDSSGPIELADDNNEDSDLDQPMDIGPGSGILDLSDDIDPNDASAIGDTIELADDSDDGETKEKSKSSSTASGTSIPLADDSDESGELSLDDELDATKSPDDTSSGSDIIDLSSDTLSNDTAADQSGMDVFDSGEIEAADSMAQTHMSDAEDDDEEDFNLESVGSGSGLLDLTQESDDTSLGADLLDEIYPGSEEGASTSVFGDDSEGSSIGGLAGLGQEQELEDQEEETSGSGQMVQMSSEAYYDAPGSGFGGGMLLGALIALVVGLIITIAAILDISSPLTTYLSKSPTTLGLWCLGILILSFVLALLGRLISKSMAS